MKITELKYCVRCGQPLPNGESIYCDGPIVDGYIESCREVMKAVRESPKQ